MANLSPFIPFTVDRFGRRMVIVYGSFILLLGVAVQTAAITCEVADGSHSDLSLDWIIRLS